MTVICVYFCDVVLFCKINMQRRESDGLTAGINDVL